MGNGNGMNGGKLSWWIISILTGSLFGVGSNMLTSTTTQGQKIAVLEHQAAQAEQRLADIERKIDRLLERK